MSILSPNSPILYREIPQKDSHTQLRPGSISAKSKGLGFDRSRKEWRNRDVKASAFMPELYNSSSVEMEPIRDSQHFDQILDNAKQLSQPILVDWMAAWCRKCIYLKPKLDKLAAEYDYKLKFYFVDVNNVPQSLVKRGNISKMPTIQIWKDGEMKAEVIGGHKAWLVIEEVRAMIQQFL